MAIVPVNQNFIQHISDDVLDSKIIPLLLDLDDPGALGTLPRVCKRWNEAMKKELPYNIKMREPGLLQKHPRLARIRSVAQTNREAFLAYFPKSLVEKMQLAYRECQENISKFEAKFLAPLIFGLPFGTEACVQVMKYLGKEPDLGLLPFAATQIPANLDWGGVQINLTTRLVCLASFFTFTALCVPLTVCNYLYHDDWFKRAGCGDLELPAVLLMMTMLSSANFLTQFEGDSILSKTYRVGKASLAACIPLAKTVGSKIKNSICRLIFKPLGS